MMSSAAQGQCEEEFIVVEIPELDESDFLRSCDGLELVDFDSASPRLVLNSHTFTGEVVETLGTHAYFRAPSTNNGGAVPTKAGCRSGSVSVAQASTSSNGDAREHKRPHSQVSQVRTGAAVLRTGASELGTARAQFVCSTTKRIRFALQRDVASSCGAASSHSTGSGSAVGGSSNPA